WQSQLRACSLFGIRRALPESDRDRRALWWAKEPFAWSHPFRSWPDTDRRRQTGRCARAPAARSRALGVAAPALEIRAPRDPRRGRARRACTWQTARRDPDLRADREGRPEGRDPIARDDGVPPGSRTRRDRPRSEARPKARRLGARRLSEHGEGPALRARP